MSRQNYIPWKFHYLHKDEAEAVKNCYWLFAIYVSFQSNKVVVAIKNERVAFVLVIIRL